MFYTDRHHLYIEGRGLLLYVMFSYLLGYGFYLFIEFTVDLVYDYFFGA